MSRAHPIVALSRLTWFTIQALLPFPIRPTIVFGSTFRLVYLFINFGHAVLVETVGKVLNSDMGALKDMSTPATEKLTQKTKANPYAHDNIKYFSWAGQVTIVTPHLLRWVGF
jgi:hypothetical protein